MDPKTFKHQNNIIPSVGFGTFQIEAKAAENIVADALNIGYRHIDTAQIYHNEDGVGAALKKSKINRNDVFLTTKVWTDFFHRKDLIASVKESLTRLKTDYVDLLLLHWPNSAVPLEETISALNEVKELGLTKNIGISNFTVELMQKAALLSKAPIFSNQIEYHPYLDQKLVLKAAEENGILITAYSPLARGKIISDPVIQKIAKDHKKTCSQVALRWLFQQAVVAIPKTLNPERARENLSIFEFSLTVAEMAEISELARADGRLISPQFAPEWD